MFVDFEILHWYTHTIILFKYMLKLSATFKKNIANELASKQPHVERISEKLNQVPLRNCDVDNEKIFNRGD